MLFVNQNDRFQIAALKMLMNIENLVTCVIIEGKLFHKVQKRYKKRSIKRSTLCLIVNGKFHS